MQLYKSGGLIFTRTIDKKMRFHRLIITLQKANNEKCKKNYRFFDIMFIFAAIHLRS